MPPLLKRILLIILLLLVAGGIAYGLYYFITRPLPVERPPTPPVTTTPPGQLPGAGVRPATTTGVVGGPGVPVLPTAELIQPPQSAYYKPTPVTQVVRDTAIAPSLNSRGFMRYYNANDGKFYRVTPSGAITPLADQIFFNATNVTWARNKDIVVIEYPDGAKIVYNFETKKQVTLPKHWEDFSFSPEGTEIAVKSIGFAPENRWLMTVGDDGTGARRIEPLGNNADSVTVSWSPSRQAVAFSQTGEPLGAERREVLFIGLNGENFKSTVVEGLGFQPQWSPTGKRLLYSVYSSRSDFKPELWIVDAHGDEIGNNRRTLALNTWAEKCTFGDESTLFCAVPNNLPQGAGMSPDIASSISDTLIKVDLKTGLKTIIPLNDTYTVKNISYDAIANKLFFTDIAKRGIFEAPL